MNIDCFDFEWHLVLYDFSQRRFNASFKGGEWSLVVGLMTGKHLEKPAIGEPRCRQKKDPEKTILQIWFNQIFESYFCTHFFHYKPRLHIVDKRSLVTRVRHRRDLENILTSKSTRDAAYSGKKGTLGWCFNIASHQWSFRFESAQWSMSCD